MKSGRFRPRTVDRIIFAILALLFVFSGAYIVGPWHLEETVYGPAPLHVVFNDSEAVEIYGLLVLATGFFLLYSAFGKVSRHYARITANALLAGCLLRLYSLMGVLLTLDSWRPPSYLSLIAIVLITGAMWLWVKLSERPTG
jgi:hypothetical protein